VVGTFYIFVWAITAGGGVEPLSAIPRPGPLPSRRSFITPARFRWGGFEMLEGVGKHKPPTEWVGVAFLRGPWLDRPRMVPRAAEALFGARVGLRPPFGLVL